MTTREESSCWHHGHSGRSATATKEAAAAEVGLVLRPTSALELLPSEVQMKIGGRKRPRTAASSGAGVGVGVGSCHPHPLPRELSLFLPPPSSSGGAVNREEEVKMDHDHQFLDPFRMRPDGGGITEIAGEGGTGKTQICLGMLVSCVCSAPINALRHPVIVIDREGDRRHPAQSSFDRHQPPTTVRNPYGGTKQLFDSGEDAVPRHRHHRYRYMRAIYVSMGEGGGGGARHEGGSAATNPAIVARLNQIATARCGGNGGNVGGGASGRADIRSRPASAVEAEARDILDRILLMRAYNVDDFEDLVHVRLPELLMRSNLTDRFDHGTSPGSGGGMGFGRVGGAGAFGEGEGPIGLIVFDSIGGLFRHDSDEHNHHHIHRTGKAGRSTTTSTSNYHADRSIVLFRAAAALKKLSNTYRVPVVVVNQVSADFAASSNKGGGSGGGCGGGGGVTPALGLGWSNCVNTRYMLTRTAIEVGMSSSRKATEDYGGGAAAGSAAAAAAAAADDDDDERRMTTTATAAASTVPARRTCRSGAVLGDGDEGPPKNRQHRHGQGNRSSSSLRFTRRVEVLLSSSVPRRSSACEFRIGPDGARLVSLESKVCVG